MKVKFHMWCLALLFALSTFAIPTIAQAHWYSGDGYYGGYGGGGIVYNSNDGKYYQVPTVGHRNVVYRTVDDQYVPVGKYGYWCHHKHCYKRFVSIGCQTRPTYWFNGHWFPQSCECFYNVR